jgi:hypothetical protein
MPKEQVHNQNEKQLHNVAHVSSSADRSNEQANRKVYTQPVNNIPPYYRDLFAAMLHDDDTIANGAYDKVLFERGLAVPHLCDQYELAYQKTTEHRKLRYYSVQLIAFSGVRTGKETVLNALSDEYYTVRKEALYAVEDLKIKDAIPLVRERLQDLNSEVRRVAQEVYDYLLSI